MNMKAPLLSQPSRQCFYRRGLFLASGEAMFSAKSDEPNVSLAHTQI